VAHYREAEGGSLHLQHRNKEKLQIEIKKSRLTIKRFVTVFFSFSAVHKAQSFQNGETTTTATWHPQTLVIITYSTLHSIYFHAVL